MSDSSTITSRPWDNQAAYEDAEWHDIYKSLFDGSGDRGPLFVATFFEVTQSSPVGMSVIVKVGAAIIGGLKAWSPSEVTLTVAANGGGSARYDLVFLHWTRTNQTVQLRIVDGTSTTCTLAVSPAANAIATYQTAGPPVSQWAIPLACIQVTPGASQILDANITDLREFCRFRTAAGNIADGTHITTGIRSGLTPAMTDTGAILKIAAGGVGVDEIAAAIAGAALDGGDGAALDILPGTGLEISADQLRIAAAAAGDGLTGGGGSALALNVDGATLVVAADILSVGAVNNGHFTNRPDYQFIAAAQMKPASGSGVSWGTLSGLPVAAEGWLFPTGANNYVIFHKKVPVGYTGETTQPLYFVWAHVNAGATLTCRWQMYYASSAGALDWRYRCGDLITTTRSGSKTANVDAADSGLRLCSATGENLYYFEVGEAYMDFQVGRMGGSDTYGASCLLLGCYVYAYRDM